MNRYDQNGCQFPKMHTKCSKISLALCGVLFCMFSITLLVLSAVSMAILGNTEKPFIQSTQTWRNDVIYDIIKRPFSCQMDEVSLVQYEFPGLREGCDCTNVDNTVSTQSCDKNYKAGCVSVSWQKKTLFEKLNRLIDAHLASNRTSNQPEDFNAYYLCGQQIPQSSFQKTYSLDGNCRKSNQKICSWGSTPQSTFCVDSAYECPISSIYYFDSQPTNNSYTRVQGTNLYFERCDQQKFPITLFQAARGSVCQTDFDNSYYETDADQYELLNFKGTGTCSGREESFRQFFSTQSRDFYSANSESLLQFPGLVQDNSLINVFSKEITQWRIDCRQDNKIEKIFDYISKQKEIQDIAISMFVISIVLVIYISLQIIACFCEGFKGLRCCQKVTPCPGFSACLCCRQCWNRRNKYDSWTDYFTLIDPCVFFTILSHFCFYGIFWLLSFGLYYQNQAQYDLINELEPRGCSDPNTNAQLADLLDWERTLFKITKAIHVMSWLIMSFYVLGVGFIWKANIKSRREVYQRVVTQEGQFPLYMTMDETNMEKYEPDRLQQFFPLNYQYMEMVGGNNTLENQNNIVHHHQPYPNPYQMAPAPHYQGIPIPMNTVQLQQTHMNPPPPPHHHQQIQLQQISNQEQNTTQQEPTAMPQ